MLSWGKKIMLSVGILIYPSAPVDASFFFFFNLLLTTTTVNKWRPIFPASPTTVAVWGVDCRRLGKPAKKQDSSPVRARAFLPFP